MSAGSGVGGQKFLFRSWSRAAQTSLCTAVLRTLPPTHGSRALHSALRLTLDLRSYSFPMAHNTMGAWSC